MSCWVHQPSEVQTEQIAKNCLWQESQVPGFTPAVNRHECWDDKAEHNFQWNEKSKREKKLKLVKKTSLIVDFMIFLA